MKVLIVEDENIVRRFIRTLIDWEANGFTIVAEASNGEEAWDILVTQPVDIVLTDIRMPVLNGFELIERIRDKELLCEIVILSSYDDFEYVRTALKLQVSDYIHKATISQDELLNCLHKARQDWLIRHEQIIIDHTMNEHTLSRRGVVGAKLLSMALEVNADMSYLELLSRNLLVWHEAFHVTLAFNDECSTISEQEEGDIIMFAHNEYWIIVGEQGMKESIAAQFTMMTASTESPITLMDWPSTYIILKRKLQERLQQQAQAQVFHVSVREAIVYMQEHYMDELTLEMLSDHVHVSPSYLSRLFQKETATTFTDYLTNIRINEAKLLLLHSDLPAYGIAERVGYRNSRYFLKLFKEAVGSTTTEFREKRQQER